MIILTVALDDKTSEALTRWLATTATTGNLPGVTPEEAIPAMIRVCLGFAEVSGTVASQIRAERAAAGGKDQEPGR